MNILLRGAQVHCFFFSKLPCLFSLFCSKCKGDKPKVTMKQRGTMVIVNQYCLTRGDNSYSWKSQPMMFNGRYPAGNVLLSFSVLMAGASISKILLVFKHTSLSAYKARTFFFPQKNFLFPAVLNYWECYPAALTEKIENMKDAVWSGDGPFDSIGHSAKFGFYTMFCNTVLKVVHFELLQVSGVVRNGQLYFWKGWRGWAIFSEQDFFQHQVVPELFFNLFHILLLRY